MKYIMTDKGKDDFTKNRAFYRNPSVKGKILSVLSSGVGYTPTSLQDFVLMDPLTNKWSTDFVRTLNQLIKDEYVKGVPEDSSTPLNLGGGL